MYIRMYVCIQDKYTPMHGAAENGHLTVIKILVNSKADVNAVTKVS